jgi:dTDP-4-dehydrorhamnose 3,5-epimerase
VAFEIIKTSLCDVLLLRPKEFADDRGFFFESFSQRDFAAATGLDVSFVQDNQSGSIHHVLRGLHYQVPPAAQGKLVRVVSGEIYDVAVDLRRHSPTFGCWTGHLLSAENRLQLWVPEGFAHGFLATGGGAEVLYKTTAYYQPSCERTIRWDDPDLKIAWPLSEKPLLSLKDEQGVKFADAELFG